MPRIRFQQRSGVVLLLSLLLMASLTASTIALATIVTSTIRQSRNLDDFIIASTAADAGLERGFAVIKAGRKQSTIESSTTGAAAATTSFTDNRSRFAVTSVASSGAITVPEMRLNQAVSFDLLNVNAVSPPSRLALTATRYTGTEVLDVSWTLIGQDGEASNTGRKVFGAQIDGTTQIINLNDVSTSTSNPTQSVVAFGYRVTIRLIQGSGTPRLMNVTAQPVDNSNAPVAIPSRVTLTSTGTAANSQAQKVASILWQLPASRLFSFVLFTENDITPVP